MNKFKSSRIIHVDKDLAIEILCRALMSAPLPADISIEDIHPEDVQKWTDRYKIWYKEIRTYVLESLKKETTNNIYYQIDRLIQEARSIQANLKTNNEPEIKIDTEKPKGIVIGQVKRKN